MGCRTPGPLLRAVLLHHPGISTILGEDDRTVALLNALRPFLKESRLAKLDRAVQISRLARVIRVLFRGMGEGGRGDV